MRYIYSLLVYMIIPFISLFMRNKLYKKHNGNKYWGERFGLGLVNKSVKPIIWIHAVSVGETRAIVKLVELLNQDYSHYQILVTQMTETGRDTAAELYPNVMLHYLPFDMPHAVKNFYKTFKPQIGLVVETEIWPNLVYYAKKFNTPLYLINARLSVRSYLVYERVKRFIVPIINNFTGILCQDLLTLDNFKSLGYINLLKVVGNTKFDLMFNAKKINIIESLIINNYKKVVVFASTRDGEEQLILENMQPYSDYLIVIIPRHPRRFKLVESLIKAKGVKYQKRSDNLLLERETQIFLGDSLGEMFTYYKIADIVVMGGSFANFGSQNLIEPIYMNKPVIIGESIYNFVKIVNDAVDGGCAIQVKNMHECFTKIENLLTNSIDYNKMLNNCKIFTKKYQGASKRIIDLIKVDL